MIDLVERRLDIKLDGPVVLPATLARYCNRLSRRFTRPVSVGLFLEYRIEYRLDHKLDHSLGDSIRHGGYAELSGSAFRLRDFYLLNRRREVRPRRHPIPQLVQISREVLLE